ncbi:2-polyprenyl-6-hydroxyphenyl methylase/3-demethylubiquinone-9 3-methyltransferase [Methylomarinovum caldicuralii]|uniref:2-polyprenyl-6-hydroxyphenyl methylase/3-demethylubiquinone-9 3-methyltransferase n=1 Tax=Methylomarinovum caldicuralii TaxID=438856 RepID=A0AAU9CKQ5_9GAMM|nr:class I SAM-dependent methyltransferase [Methylomarinovum caldicuralii]BCX82261.1 2-polyprenyl-6-hydroxyphenyl methylase/3-demethylubiquinone-9 3-methyltransferase [Methylomarinovum caldicuralii]
MAETKQVRTQSGLEFEAPCFPDCGASSLMIGPIPAADGFAGRVLPSPLDGGRLYRCSECHLGFRCPRLGKGELDRLYAEGREDTWSQKQEGRQDWRSTREFLLQNFPEGASILDVGCFDGAFLAPLVGRFQCYGIEIHPSARKRGESRGIKIIGADFFEIRGTFDCITAIDVIEHVENPRLFLKQMLDHVGNGGRVLISTGNLDAWTWRLMGGRYLYCTCAENMAFISPMWAKLQAERYGLEIEHLSFFAHADYRWTQFLRGFAINLVYRFLPGVIRHLRKKGLGGHDAQRFPELADYPPPWPGAKDHFLVVLRKP